MLTIGGYAGLLTSIRPRILDFALGRDSRHGRGLGQLIISSIFHIPPFQRAGVLFAVLRIAGLRRMTKGNIREKAYAIATKMLFTHILAARRAGA